MKPIQSIEKVLLLFYECMLFDFWHAPKSVSMSCHTNSNESSAEVSFEGMLAEEYSIIYNLHFLICNYKSAINFKFCCDFQ